MASFPISGGITGGSMNTIDQWQYHDSMRRYLDMQERTPTLLDMIRMRLRGLNFQHIHAHKTKEEKVVVLVIANDAPVLLEDEWPLFPSDTLITQLRLLEGK